MTGLEDTAEGLLKELGIRHPSEIDIEAIAQYCGATVLYESLAGCAARILGYGDRAFITVSAHDSRARQRFSAGHELGHWLLDRARVSAFACTDAQIASSWSKNDPEKRANRFAASLLLPTSMFRDEARLRPITFEVARELASTFSTSLTATSIRLLDLGSFPAMLVCLEPGSRRWKWHLRSKDVPGSLWPVDLPGEGTFAAEILAGRQDSGCGEVGSWGWFDHPGVDRFSVHEDTLAIGGVVLSLLWWKDESQLVALSGSE